MKRYKILKKNRFSSGRFSIVPIRNEDRYLIMEWRNQQIYHLRQLEPLTRADQDAYFSEIVSELFAKDQPEQVLFSYLEDDTCIGYGGLVHINWVDQNAEISFILNTNLEQNYFSFHWQIFLGLIEKVSFRELLLHKIFIFAFDLRPHLYQTIENAGFFRDAILKDHCRFENKFIDVIIHSKLKVLS